MPCEKCENGKYKWGKTGECKYDTKADCEEDNKDYYEDMKETKILELVIADDSQELAIDAISLVTSPAIEQDFVFFGKEKNNLTFAKVDEEKRMLVSPALIPNKNIFRHNPNTQEDYYVYFSKETVRKASELYLKHNNHHKATYQHQDRVSGVLTVESWIKEGDMDKSKLYGYDLPNGTWFVKMKIENDELWNKIKEGELKGLSIEGYFTNKFEQMNKKQPTTEQILSALNELVRENKIELKNEKIELGAIDDLNKIGRKFNSALSEVKDAGEAAAKWNEKVEKLGKIILKLFPKVNGLEDEISSQIKGLGLSEKDVPSLKDARESLDNFYTYRKKYNF